MAFLFNDDTNERHYLYEDDQTDYGGQKQLFDTDYVVVIPRKDFFLWKRFGEMEQ